MESVLRNFWLRSWSEDKDVHTKEDISIVAKNAGMNDNEIQECLNKMNTENVKVALKVIDEHNFDFLLFIEFILGCNIRSCR